MTFAAYERITVLLTLPLTFVGFVIAYLQIHKVQSSADAASEAARDVRERIARNLLLTLLQQLQRVEQEIDAAVAGDRRELAVHYLVAWRWQAGQVRRLLEDEKDLGNRTKVLKGIQQSITLAGLAKLDVDDRTRPLKDIMRTTQLAITTVTNEVGALSASLTSAKEGPDGR